MRTYFLRLSRTSLLLVGAATLLLAGLASPSAAITYVNRSNPNDPNSVSDVTLTGQTWTTTGDPYIIEGKVTVAGGTTLTVNTGVQVQVASGKGIYVLGRLNATNANFGIYGSGYWAGIYFSANSGLSTLSGCTIDRAGSDVGLGTYHGSLRTAAVYVDNSNPTFTGCTFSNSGDDGIELYSSNAAIQGCTFTGIQLTDFAVLNDTADCFPVVSANTATGVGYLGIGVLQGSIFSGRWRNAGDAFAWYLRGSVTLYDMQIDAGATIRAIGKVGITVADTLTADGTAADPIVFTTAGRPTSAGGDWLGIGFGDLTDGSLMDYCEVRYAGSALGLGQANGNRKAAVFINRSQVTITNCLIADSETNGLEVISTVGTGGSTGQHSTVQNCTFTNVKDGYYAILSDDASCFMTVSGNTATGAGFLGIGLPAGDLGESGTYRRGGTDFPYFLNGNITVPFQQTLTISPGVTMKSANGSGFWVDGTLNAIGTALNPITFTSSKAVPTNANFGNFTFATGGGLSDLVYCNIEYPKAPAVLVLDPDTNISNCRFTHGQGNYVVVNVPTATIQNNVFEDVNISSYAVVYTFPNCFPNISGNSASGPGLPGVKLPFGTFTTSGTWQDPGTMPYYLSGDIIVGTSTTITVAPGSAFRASGTGFFVNGTLKAIGTAQLPITFTSNNLFPAAGDWKGIYFTSTADACELEFAEVDYAGSILGDPVTGNSAVRVNGNNVDIDHVTIRHPWGHGIRLKDSTSAVAACTFQSLLAGNYAVYLETPDTFPLVSSNTASGDGFGGIRVAPGGLTAGKSGTWQKGGTDFPWFLPGSYTVGEGASLTILPGTTVKAGNAGLYADGTLIAGGLPGNRIVFTSMQDTPAPGDWKGIYVAPTSLSPVIKSVDILYAGADSGLGTYHGGTRKAALYLDGNSPALEGLRVLHSAANGIEVFDSDGMVFSSLLWDNAEAAIHAEGVSGLQVMNCTLYGNGTGVRLIDSAPHLTNNIVAGNTVGISRSGLQGAALQYNDVFGNTTQFDNHPDLSGTFGNAVLEPGFANPAAGDFRLTASSKNINAGTNATIKPAATDLAGSPRIQDATVDRGSYEAGVIPPFSLLDAAKALQIAGGLGPALADNMARLNLVTAGPSAGRIDIQDAGAVVRKATGLDGNP